MNIILVAVTSLNGKLTKGEDPHIYSWTSKEDQQFFFNLIEQNNLIVMGRGTYEAIKSKVKMQKSKLRVILTGNPDRYKTDEVEGQLEFSNESPQELVKRVKKLGYNQMLLVGGSQVYSSFMAAGLVDELYLTLEPKIFGKGKPLMAEGSFEKDVELVSMERLNEKGTILLKYSIESQSAKVKMQNHNLKLKSF